MAVEERNESSSLLPQPPIRFDRFELDAESGELRRGGVPVDLSPLLSKVLLMLAERPGQLVTRKQIKRALWSGEAYGDFDSRLNFTIEKLRAALDDDAYQPRYIQTVRNSGYRFIAPIRGDQPRPFVVGAAEDAAQHDLLPEAIDEVKPRKGWHVPANELLLVLIAVLVLGAAGTAILAMRKGDPASVNQPPAGKTESGPEITSVTPILPQRRQSIVINGRGFGSHSPYTHTDSPYLAIRDQTGGWAAGRILPQSHDEVMVDVDSWTDTEIALSGFSGDYGKNGWALNPGDNLEIAIWNAQSGAGPALFNIRVSPNIP